jgi:hypothetical protein
VEGGFYDPVMIIGVGVRYARAVYFVRPAAHVLSLPVFFHDVLQFGRHSVIHSTLACLAMRAHLHVYTSITLL